MLADRDYMKKEKKPNSFSEKLKDLFKRVKKYFSR